MAKKWIQKAVNPAHKGYCTPMTKKTCTPRRKALARTFKKHHGFHKSPDGGEVGIKDKELKANYGEGIPLNEIFYLPKDQSKQEMLQSVGPLKDRINQIRWANFHGKMMDYPEDKSVPVFRFDDPKVQAEMKKRGLTKEYINSWQPSNYPEEFSFGGIISSIGKGAATGAGSGLLAGGIGAVPGAIIGGIGGLFGGLFNHFGEKRQEKLLAQQQGTQNGIAVNDADIAAINGSSTRNQAMLNMGYDPNSYGQTMVNNQYAPTFATGGDIERMPVELENDEIFRVSGQNRLSEVDGKYHSQGGEGYELPVGTEVLGKNVNPTTGNMFKQDGMKLKRKQDRILSRESRPGTIGERTDKMRLEKVNQAYTDLFTAQEEMKCGGKVKRRMPGGGYVPYTPTITPDKIGNLYQTTGGHSFGGSAQVNPGFFGKVGNALGGIDFGNILNTAGQLAPIGYNLIQGMQPAQHLTASDYYNPEYGTAMASGQRSLDTLANRKFDVNPLLEANRNAQAIGDYNARTQGGLSAGAVASNRLVGTAQRMRGDQQAWATKQNAENQYLGDLAQGQFNYGQMAAGLGQQRAATDLTIADYNMQSDAARRAALGQGFADLGEYAQTQQLMRNQQERDSSLASIYPDMFGTVMPFMQGTQNVLNKYR